jgi:threonylcarbamoyladenosine tRNA methylthiotransferase CDKAL1
MTKMRVHLKTYGCSANQADSETFKGCLAQADIQLVDSAANADVIVVNTCAVKGPTENRVINALKRVPQGKKLVVAGCLPLTSFSRLSREVRFDGAVGPAAGEEIVEVVKRVFRGEKVTVLSAALAAKPDLALPQLRSNPVVSVVPVNYGCLGSCAYCCVVFARGRLRSHTVEEVSARVRRDLADGAREFWITSQDTGCYGRDVGVDLAVLLEALSAINGDFRVRVGMMTPNLVADIVDRLVAAFRNPKVFKFLHLPVQSGDDTVLRRMRRFYTVQEFKDLVNLFRRAFPRVTLATDVICGFPGETPAAFENTLKLVREVKPDIVNVSKFFPRPGTAAAEMHGRFVEVAEIKRRSTRAAQLARQVALERNQRWIGWTGEVLVDERGKVPGTWIGRNFAYKPITIQSREKLLGKTVRVKIVNAFPTYLSGVTS